MNMETLTYSVSFTTPAFLGNAEQQAQWRTPPFKALIRQWWRVVKAPQVRYDHSKLLDMENGLFGAAFDGEGAKSHRSQMQVRLSGWELGSVTRDKDAVELKWVDHHEVDPRKSKPYLGERKVRADVYLGYGPIGRSSAISPNTTPLTLKLRCQETDAPDIRKAMQLAAWFGTLGSRSRNGWGSLNLEGEGLTDLDGLCDSKLAEQAPLRTLPTALGDRLAGEWPHSVGLCEDSRPAVWRVFHLRDAAQGKYVGFPDWKSVMERLAALKIRFRTEFSLKDMPTPHSKVEDRLILAYPVTHHGLSGLKDARLASQMRFKVAKNKAGEFFGLITHLPCAMPSAFFSGSNIRPPDISRQIEVWQQVHQFLNAQPSVITRIRKG
jgi:CRISPR-associated protein Cmr1